MSLSIDEILALIESMEKETKALKYDLFKMCWFMRGGLSLAEAYCIDVLDRVLVSDLIKENLNIAKETGLPYF